MVALARPRPGWAWGRRDAPQANGRLGRPRTPHARGAFGIGSPRAPQAGVEREHLEGRLAAWGRPLAPTRACGGGRPSAPQSGLQHAEWGPAKRAPMQHAGGTWGRARAPQSSLQQGSEHEDAEGAGRARPWPSGACGRGAGRARSVEHAACGLGPASAPNEPSSRKAAQFTLRLPPGAGRARPRPERACGMGAGRGQLGIDHARAEWGPGERAPGPAERTERCLASAPQAILRRATGGRLARPSPACCGSSRPPRAHQASAQEPDWGPRSRRRTASADQANQ